MTISIEARMCAYRAVVKTMNTCTCPVVREMLLQELFRQYRMLTAQLDPVVMAYQNALEKSRRGPHGCSASDIGGDPHEERP